MKRNQDQGATAKEFPGQHEGERVVLVFRQHPVVLRKPLIFGLLAIVVSILPLDVIYNGPLYSSLVKLPALVIGLVILYWFYHWVGWYYSVYIVTDQRLIDIRQKGFFNRRVSEVGFEKVQSINYHVKGFQAAILKFGDITVQTYTGDWVLQSVHHPEDVHTKMLEVTHTIPSTLPMK
jgi:uncharacterized membrane protein YdbT with pleckstrin-like domain